MKTCHQLEQSCALASAGTVAGGLVMEFRGDACGMGGSQSIKVDVAHQFFFLIFLTWHGVAFVSLRDQCCCHLSFTMWVLPKFKDFTGYIT